MFPDAAKSFLPIELNKFYGLIKTKMIPGSGKINPKQMEKMMRKMGMKVSELQDVIKVVIEREESSIIFDNPRITILHTPQGDNYEISGESRVVEKEEKEQDEIGEEDYDELINVIKKYVRGT